MTITSSERICDKCGDTLLFKETKGKFDYEATCENCEQENRE